MTRKQMITASIPNVSFDKWTICDGNIDKAIFALQELKRISEEQGFTQISLDLDNCESDYFDVSLRGVRLETDKEFNKRLKQEEKEREIKKKRKEASKKLKRQTVEAQKEMLRKLKRKYPNV